jgi:hypothetical protein
MKSLAFGVIGFILGAGIGGGVSYVILKRQQTEKLNQIINELNNAEFDNSEEENEASREDNDSSDEEASDENHDEYGDLASEYNNRNYRPETGVKIDPDGTRHWVGVYGVLVKGPGPDPKNPSAPYYLTPDEFANFDWEEVIADEYYDEDEHTPLSLYLSTDGKLFDMYYQEFDNYDILPPDFKDHMGEYDEGVLYVRNMSLTRDIEVLADDRSSYDFEVLRERIN